MMKRLERSGRSFLAHSRRAVVILLAILVVVVTVAGGWLYQEVSLLRSAPRDNIQWTTTQLEVDAFQFHLAVEYARAGEASLDDVRRRFDILYSRIRLVSQSELYEGLRETPVGHQSIEVLNHFLDDTTPLIDSPDEDLHKALDRIDDWLFEVNQASRAFAVESIQYFADLSDKERKRFVQVLTLAAVGGVLLIGLLAVLLAYIVRQHRQAANRAAEIERNRSLLNAINEAALDAIVVANDQGHIIGWNRAAEDIFGYAENQAIRSSLSSLIVPPQYRAAHEAGMRRYLTTGEKRVVDAGRIELSALRADGSEFPVELAIAGSERDDSQIFICYLRDISARRAAQQELLETRDAAMAADRAKSEFLAVMSHEMRTPLNGVLGVLELLQASPLDERQRRYVESAVFSGEVLLRHINDVLDLSRIEAGKMTYELEPLDLSVAIDQVIEIGRTAAEANGNRIDVSVGPGLTGLMGDAHRIRQVLLNLVNNAGKFTHDGRILVSATMVSGDEDGVETEFSVTDSGIGIPEEERETVFEDFITLDSAFNRSNTGSGLGLAICRRIVNDMGGSIGISDGFDGGSRFWVRLRMARATITPQTAGTASTLQVALEHQSVLIVEDNDINRMVAREMLESAGLRISEAHDGHEGIAAAEKERFDLILMDISMPGIDGIETTRRLREGKGINAKTPIIGLTAHVMPEVRDAVMAAGMQDCLSKPLRRNEMLALISSYSGQDIPVANVSNGRAAAEYPLIDEDTYSDLADSLPAKVFQTTLHKAIEQLRNLTDHLAEDQTGADPDELAAAVHKGAGVAAIIGASRLHSHLSALEEAIKMKRYKDYKKLVNSAKNTANSTIKILIERKNESI